MNNIKVSILIPVYNVEKYLAKCLDSLVNQSLKEIEIIAVLDECTDNSAKILKQFADKDSRIRIINQKRTNTYGLAGARNIGIDHASGKYIMFVDTDDWLEKSAAEELYCLSENHKTDMISFDYVSEFEKERADDHQKGNISPAHKQRKGNYCGIHSGIELLKELQDNNELIYASWSDIYRTSFLKENNLYFYEGITCEDVFFRFLCLIKAQRVMCVNKVYYHYLHRSTSLTGRINSLRAINVKADIVFLAEAMSIIKELAVSDNDKKILLKYCGDRFDDLLNNYYQTHDCDVSPLKFVDTKQMIFWDNFKFFTEFSHNLIRDFSDEEKDKLYNFSDIVIYGAGKAGKQMIRLLSDYGINKFDVVVSRLNDSNIDEYLCGIKVREISALNSDKDSTLILICVKNKSTSFEMTENAKKIGYSNIWSMGR